VAKGLSRSQIVRHHLLPNAAIPITTIIGLELGVLMSGTIIVEVIFSWPGVGSLLYQAVNVRDTPLTTGVVVVYTTLFIALNVLIDLFYFVIDPRVGAAGGVRH
jgi:ABC-type dipeptide/oligopeptide/nickel transport system permease component